METLIWEQLLDLSIKSECAEHQASRARGFTHQLQPSFKRRKPHIGTETSGKGAAADEGGKEGGVVEVG